MVSSFDRLGRIATELFWEPVTGKFPLFARGFFPPIETRNIAELAAGTGRLTQQLVDRYPGKILAHDRGAFEPRLDSGRLPDRLTSVRSMPLPALLDRLRGEGRLRGFDLVYCVLPEKEEAYAETAAQLVADGGEAHFLVDDFKFAQAVEGILQSAGLVTWSSEIPSPLRGELSALASGDIGGLLDMGVPFVWVAGKRRPPHPFEKPVEGGLVYPKVTSGGETIAGGGFCLAGSARLLDMEDLFGRPMSDEPLFRGLQIAVPGYRVGSVDISKTAEEAVRIGGTIVYTDTTSVGEFEYQIRTPPGIDSRWEATRIKMELQEAHRRKGVARSFFQHWLRFLRELGVDRVRASEGSLLFDLSVDSPGWTRLFR